MRLLLIISIVAISACSSFKKKKISSKEITKKLKETHPLLTKPRVKKVWVDDQVVGDRFVKGHYEYIIQENSKWSN